MLSKSSNTHFHQVVKWLWKCFENTDYMREGVEEQLFENMNDAAKSMS